MLLVSYSNYYTKKQVLNNIFLMICAYRRNRSELFQPAGGSRTGLLHELSLGLSSGKVSYGKDNTAAHPHTPYHR